MRRKTLRRNDIRNEMSWDDTDCGDNVMQRAFISKRSCDAMKSDEVRKDQPSKRWHWNEGSRGCCCEAQKACPHPMGAVFVPLYRL